MMEPKFYIASFEHSWQLVAWRRPNGHGYTTDLREAGLYGEAQAIAIVARAELGKEAIVPEEAAGKLASLTVDLCALRSWMDAKGEETGR